MSLDEKQLENKIFKRFDELKDGGLVSKFVENSDFELKEVLKFLSRVSDKKVLDVGCGKGKISRKLKDLGFDVIGIEPSIELIKIARKNNPDIKFIQASATNLPFEKETFDFLICIEVLEHIPDTKKAIKEMIRVLKLNGKVLIIDKNILSLNPDYLIPTFFLKRFLENRNKWMYPKNFPFKEKYFIPWKLNNVLKKYCSQTKIEYLYYKASGGNVSSLRKIIICITNIISLFMHKFFPFLDLFIAWEGTKTYNKT